MSSTKTTQNKFSAEKGTEAPRHRKKTREQRQRDKEQPKEVRAPENRGSKNRERGQQKEGQNRTQTQEHQHQEGRQGAGRQQRTGGEGAREDQRGCTHALVDVQRGTWNINDEYLSAAAQSNAKSLQGGVEGKNTPHRAEPLVPQWKRRDVNREPLTLHSIS